MNQNRGLMAIHISVFYAVCQGKFPMKVDLPPITCRQTRSASTSFSESALLRLLMEKMFQRSFKSEAFFRVAVAQSRRVGLRASFWWFLCRTKCKLFSFMLGNKCWLLILVEGENGTFGSGCRNLLYFAIDRDAVKFRFAYFWVKHRFGACVSCWPAFRLHSNFIIHE